jgi:hypothetical protein
MERSDTIERVRVREVAALFHSHEELEAAAKDLLLAGFDRSDMDRLGDISKLGRRLGPIYVAHEELADIPEAPRQPVMMQEDIVLTLALVVGVAAAFFGLICVLIVIALGGSGAAAMAIGLVVALVAGVVAGLLTYRKLQPPEQRALRPLMESRGLVLWVHVHSPEREETARDILCRHGGQAIRVHEIYREKDPDEIPLSSVQPDPWLGSEPLGRP